MKLNAILNWLIGLLVMLGLLLQYYFFWNGEESIQKAVLFIISGFLIISVLVNLRSKPFKLGGVSLVLLATLIPFYSSNIVWIWFMVLVALILRIIHYFRSDQKQLEIPLVKKYPLMAIIPLAGILLFFLKSRSSLATAELPVLILVMCLGVFYYFSLNRWNKISHKQFRFSIMGGLLIIAGTLALIWANHVSDNDIAFWVNYPFYVFGILLLLHSDAHSEN